MPYEKGVVGAKKRDLVNILKILLLAISEMTRLCVAGAVSLW